MKTIRAVALGLAASVIGLPAANAGYDTHPKFDQFAAELEKEYQIPKDEARHWLSQSKKQQSVLDAISRPAEKTMEWDRYQDIFLTEKRIQQGKEFMVKYQDLLAAAEAKYGVPPQIISAIIGVETYYGQRQGNYRVLDSLATLAFDYPKRPIFWRELKAFFAVAETEGKDPATMKGSYAGAMGYGQFIPTSFLSYAVDGDGDGKRDLWSNPADAIFSVANYFNRHGWRSGEDVIQRARVSGDSYEDAVNDSLKPKWTVAELKAKGVEPTRAVKDDAEASLVKLIGKNGAEFWLGEYNYYVITRYNHSRLYAMAVYQLSEALTQ